MGLLIPSFSSRNSAMDVTSPALVLLRSLPKWVLTSMCWLTSSPCTVLSPPTPSPSPSPSPVPSQSVTPSRTPTPSNRCVCNCNAFTCDIRVDPLHRFDTFSYYRTSDFDDIDTITIPSVTVPTVTVPTFTVPTVTVPTVTV